MRNETLNAAVTLPCAAGEGDNRSWWTGRPHMPALAAAPSTAFGGPPSPCFAWERITEGLVHSSTRSNIEGVQ